MRLILILSGGVAILLSGCYGYSAEAQVTHAEAYSYRPHQRFIELFYDDGEPKRPYKQIAMIEIDGAEYDGNVILLEAMKREARKLGADAVIKIRRGTTVRESGDIVTAILSDEEPESYTASVLSGVAIKYTDSLQTGEWQ